MPDYEDTIVLPQRVVDDAISGADRQKNEAVLEEVSNSARIAALDKTLGKVVEVQVSHERQIADVMRRVRLRDIELETIKRSLDLRGYLLLGIVVALAYLAL
jgi:hypothetical protein